jgi:predicted Zn-dependent protease with MMP-like domain
MIDSSARAQHLTALAEDEVRRIIAALPTELRAPAQSIPLVYDSRNIDDLEADGVNGTLGLFVGANFVESAQGAEALPAQIILYLENIWWEAYEAEDDYRREIRATYLHELGHFLGLEEIDLEERGL